MSLPWLYLRSAALHFSHEAEPLAHRAAKRSRQQQEQDAAASSSRPGLLQALLAKEVRAERSLLLQCIRKLVIAINRKRRHPDADEGEAGDSMQTE